MLAPMLLMIGKMRRSGAAHVHVAVATSGGSGDPAQILRQHFPRRNATHQQCRHVSVRGTKIVIRPAMSRAAGGNRFLAAAGVAAAQDLALTVELEFDAVFHFPHQNHVVEKLLAKFGCNVGEGWR